MSASYGAVSVGTSATLIKAANLRRKNLDLHNNHGSATVYWGSNDSVTTSNGFPLAAGKAKAFSQDVLTGADDVAIYTGPVYGIVASGTVDIRYWEEDDT